MVVLVDPSLLQGGAPLGERQEIDAGCLKTC
jgi:hypothetical protein